MLQRYLFIPAGHRDNLGAVLGRKYQGYRKAAVIKSRYAHACAQLPAVNHKCIGIYGKIYKYGRTVRRALIWLQQSLPRAIFIIVPVTGTSVSSDIIKPFSFKICWRR